ncbi:TonB-dependent receptor plug domain-containing protein [Mangrovimonas aestuarii]|uniref:TonB-dependent receptor plug domain-containing protein n=1 Tax=Mangrovimonas aestuarii TaxID=3018443 RepID=UPI0023785091|nr:TonB-dependent receptor [Mangrovimonas aestuarii]
MAVQLCWSQLARKVSLQTALNTIEPYYQISFSYADDLIDGKFVSPPDTTKKLPEVLEALSLDCRLAFQLLSKGHYAIIPINKSDNLPILPQELEEVVIMDYLTSGISQRPYGLTTISPKKFGILPGLIEQDILQTVQALPGIVSVDETISNINIRGGTHDQNLILWEGIKMYQSGHFFGMISAFNPYLTEQVNISKNGSSAQYGDGVSSIIDMRLGNTLTNDTKLGLGINLINTDGFISTPLSKKMELQVAARRAITDWVDTPTYQEYSNRVFQDTDIENTNGNTLSKSEEFYFYDISLKLLYDISETDKLRASLLSVYNNLSYLELATSNTNDQAKGSDLTQSNLATGLEYTKDWNPNTETTIFISISDYNLDATNQDVITEQRLSQKNEVLETALKFNLDKKLSNQLILNSGYQFSETGVGNLEDVNNPAFSRYIKRVLRNHAMYTEGRYQSKNKKTNVQLGVRANYFGKFEQFRVEPRLSFDYQLNNHLNLQVLGELKSQTTTQIIDYPKDFLGIEKRRWVIANNEGIPITKSKQISVGLSYHKNKLHASIEAYLKEVDGISTRSQGFQNQYQYTQTIGQYNIKGIDLLVNKQFRQFSTWFSYSLSQNNYKFPSLNSGEDFPNNLDLQHIFSGAGTYTINSFKVALGVNWHSGKPFTTPLNFTAPNGVIQYNPPNTDRLEDYFRTDISATYKVKLNKKTEAILGASVWNIFNRKNIINSYYAVGDDGIVNKIDISALGLTPNVSLRVNFK